MVEKDQTFWDKKNEEKINNIVLGQAIKIVSAKWNIDAAITEQSSTIKYTQECLALYKVIKDIRKELKENGENI